MKNKKILIAIIGGVVVVAGVATAIILINANKGGNPNNNSNNSSQSTTNGENNSSENPNNSSNNSSNGDNNNSSNNGNSNSGNSGNSGNNENNGNSGNNSNSSASQNPIVGTWRYDDPEFVNAGIELSYTFNADGTGSYNGAGKISQFTYTTSGNNLHADFGESGPMNVEYSISGDTLYIKDITGNNTPYKKIK